MKGKEAIWSNTLLGATFALMVISLYMVFIYSPIEKTMGIVQKIFYFHVPMAWVAFLAFGVVFVTSILYLWRRQKRWDTLAHSSAEIGVVFCTLVLITGPIWARPAWGVWWTWDARLTTTLVLWLIYLAYLLAHSFATEESRGARFAAVVGIVGFLDIPIVALATTWWRTQHPSPMVFESGGVAPPMLLTLLISLATFTLLYILLLICRLRLKQIEAELAELKQLEP